MQTAEEVIRNLAVAEETARDGEDVDREELTRLAYWHWEMRGFPQDRPEQDWAFAREELRRQRSRRA
jgi:hypothetical protein